MSSILEKRVSALELASPADGPVIVVRFIVKPDAPEAEAHRARAGDVELTRSLDESSADFIERAKAAALETRRPNCGATVIVWPG